MLYAAIDGAMRCRACGKLARLDLFSRWLISIMIALILPGVLLWGQVFYSGHLFVVSMVLIFAGWRVLSYIVLPCLSLEPAVSERPPLRPRQSAFVLSVLLAAGSVMDVFMAAHFEEHAEQAAVPSAVSREERLDPLLDRPRERRESKSTELAL